MRRRSGVVAVLVLATVAVVSAAFAYFATTGSGSGPAQTRAPSAAVTLGPGTTTGTLYPSGTAVGTVTVTATNPDDADVRIGSLQIDTTKGTSGFAVDAAHSGCTTSSLTFTTQSTGWVVPGNGSLPITLASSLSMATSAPDACQGAVFTVHLKVAS